MTEQAQDFILLLLSQFAGGPGPVENNLVRFGLPAILWAVLLYIAWTRQRSQNLPREKLLVWGFGLALVRELYMFGQMTYRLLDSNAEATCEVIQPLEHGLAMAAMIVVAGAFLMYILEDPKIAKSYLLAGIGITMLALIFTSWAWPRQLVTFPQIKFHQTWAAWLFHVPLSILMVIAVILLLRKRGWLRNIVAAALTLYLISELLLLVNYGTARKYNAIICPIGNSLHILAIPLLGYVYLHEQALEKKQAEESLIEYRDHLEDLIDERTAELTSVNTKLKQEVFERTQAEEALELVTHRYELILESTGEGICGINHQGQITFANPAAARLLGYPTGELINRPGYSIWHRIQSESNPHPLETCPIYQGYSRGIQHRGDDETFSRVDGVGFPIRYFSNPVWEKSELVGSVLVFQDITERKRHEAEIAQRNRDAEDWAVELSRLQIASSNLAATINLDQVTSEIALQSAWLLRSQKACVIRMDGQNDQFKLAAGFGLNQMEQQTLRNDLSEWEFLTDLVSRPETIAISDAFADSRLPEGFKKQLDLQAILITPIWSSKNPREFIILMEMSASRQWSRQEIELIESLANRAAVALMNANLHHQLELAAALEERQRIAANMHDGLAQTLSLLGLRVDRIYEMVEADSDPKTEEAISEIRDVVTRASLEVRRSIASLQEAPRLQSSLQDLLQGILGNLRTGGGPELNFDPGSVQPLYILNEQTEQIISVVQEALLNAVRHAQAQTVLVRLEKVQGKIRITVVDDGIGFNLDHLDQSGNHFGLSIMQARTARIGGQFQINTSPGNGTKIRLTWTPEYYDGRNSNLPPGF